MTVEDQVSALYRHLAATAELPVERRSSRLLGEAEAVADDMRSCDPSIAESRAGVVVELLARIDETGNDEADEHVEAAREIATDLATG